MPSFFSGFDIVKKNAFGITYKIPNQVIHVWKVEANGTLTRLTNLAPASGTDSLTSDSFGEIHGGQLTAVAPQTKLRFARPGETAVDDPHVLRTTNALQIEIAIETDLTLLLDDLYEAAPDDIAYIQIFMRSGPNADPVLIGTVAPGETLSLPYNPAQDNEVQFFAISWSAAGVAHTFDLTAAPSVTITPNREVLRPSISQDGAAQNARINFRATNFTPLAKLRKIQWASNNTFTSNLMERLEGNAASTTQLPAEFFIERTTNLSNAETVYVRIAHSSGGAIFGEWSEVKSATFANSGGGGGSGGSAPPSNLSGWGAGADVNLFWTNNGGTSSNRVLRNGLEIDALSASSFSYSDSLYSEGYGYYQYQVENDDGSTNAWGYLYYNEGGF